MKNVRDYGAGLGSSGDEGAFIAAIADAEAGDTIYLPECPFNSNIYLLNSKLDITKNLHFIGESPSVGVRRIGTGPIFDVDLTGANVFFSLEKLRIISGTIGLDMTVTGTTHKTRTYIKDCVFEKQTTSAINARSAQGGLSVRLENSTFLSGGSYGVQLSSSGLYSIIKIEGCSFESNKRPALRVAHNADVSASGTCLIRDNEFLENIVGIIFESTTGSLNGNSYFGNTVNTELSGTGRILSGTLISV